jgi:hypothetical protein
MIVILTKKNGIVFLAYTIGYREKDFEEMRFIINFISYNNYILSCNAVR